MCSKGDGELNWLPRRLKLWARASTQKPFSGMGLPPFTTVTAVLQPAAGDSGPPLNHSVCTAVL